MKLIQYCTTRRVMKLVLACTLVGAGTSAVALTSIPSDLAVRADVSHFDHSAIDWNKVLSNASGHKYYVSSVSQFNSVARAVRPGDVVIIRNGTYSNWQFYIRNSGTRTQPIVYMAETPGKVIFTGDTLLRITSSFNLFGGFTFRNLRDQRYPIQLNKASDSRLTGNEFYSSGGYDFGRLVSVSNGSNRNRFDHNFFVDNRSFGMGVVLPRDGIDSFAYSQDNRFDHNVFKDISGPTTGVRIPLQVGQFPNHTRNESRTTIDHNDFLNISVSPVNSKSTGEVYVANYFENIRNTAAISIRSGNRKVFDRNRFKNVNQAMRVSGETIIITNNLITDARDDAILIPRWGTFDSTVRGKTGMILVSHNTIDNAASNAVEIGRRWGSTNNIADNVPYDVDITNNIFAGSAPSGYILDYGTSDLVVDRNAYENASSVLGSVRQSGAVSGNLRLDANYVPQSGSSAIGNASSNTGIGHDFINAPRSGGRDRGSREVSTGYTSSCKQHLVGTTYSRTWCD